MTIFSDAINSAVGWTPQIIDVSDPRCKKYRFEWVYGRNSISMLNKNVTVAIVSFNDDLKTIEKAKKRVSDYIDENQHLIKK